MVDGNGDDERKTKYFILSIFICVFAGSFQERIFEIQIVQIFLVENYQIERVWWKNEINRIFRDIELFNPPK